jgi:hypothetical protein
MNDPDEDRYRRLAEAKNTRRLERNKLEADNWRDVHDGVYQVADRAVGPTEQAPR